MYNKDEVRVLLWDIEVLPNLGYFWELRDKYGMIPKEFVIQNKSICTIAYKWLGEEKVSYLSVSDYRTFNKDPYDDSLLIKDFAKVLEKADRAVAHYGDKFDIPFLSARTMFNGLPSLKVPKTIDTKAEAARTFKLMANSLNYIADYLGLGTKDKMEASDWVDFINKDKIAINKMIEYNIQDVLLLEKVYLTMRPYLKNDEGHRAVHDYSVCIACGSNKLKKNGRKIMLKKICQNYQCTECGRNFHDPNTNLKV